jgi:hypothetical protein
LQSHATPITQFTETINTGNVDVYYDPYHGSFTESGLSAGWSDSDTISSASVVVDMKDAAGNSVFLTINGATLSDLFTSTETYTYGENAQDSYITGVFDKNGSFGFSVVADCYLESVELIVNIQTPQGGQKPVPDASSTVILLGGALSGLALLKRKLI